MQNFQNGPFDPNTTVLFAAKLGLGLSALYYGVLWLITAEQYFHTANELEAASVPFRMIGDRLSQYNNSYFDGINEFLKNGLAITHSTVKKNNTRGAMSLITGGLCLFSAARTAKSLVTGSPLGYIDVAIDTIAALATANTVRKKI